MIVVREVFEILLVMLPVRQANGETLKFSKRAMEGAAAGGHLEMVKWLNDKQVESSVDAMDLAAQEGHLDVVQVRRSSHRRAWSQLNPAAFGRAVGHRRTTSPRLPRSQQMNEWAISLGAVDFQDVCRGVAAVVDCTTNHHDVEVGRVDPVASSHDNAVATRLLLGTFSTYGPADLQWLHENRTEGCSMSALAMAARRGHLKMVQWFYENNVPGDIGKAIVEANEAGHSEVGRHVQHGCESFFENLDSVPEILAEYSVVGIP